MNQHRTTHHTAYWTYNDRLELPVIVMVHGFRGTHHGLDLVARQMNGYRIIVPDIPGYGATEPLECEHSVENYVSWLNKFIKDLQLAEPPVLMGHSFGSIIAASFAASNPKSIAKLILVNPIGAPALKGPRATLSKISSAYFWFGSKLPERAATKWFSSNAFSKASVTAMVKTNDKEIKKYINDQHKKNLSPNTNKRVISESYKASVSSTVRDWATGISVPTLLIAGDLDDVTSLDKQYELADMFPNASIEVIKNVGHLTQYETPVEVADAIKKFLR